MTKESGIFKYRNLTNFEKVLFLEHQIKRLVKALREKSLEVGFVQSEKQEAIFNQKKAFDEMLEKDKTERRWYFLNAQVKSLQAKNKRLEIDLQREKQKNSTLQVEKNNLITQLVNK